MQITGHTRLGCLLGSPVAHSISPMMHNDSFQALDIDHTYLCFDIRPDQLPSTVQALRQMNCFGFNLTMPHKSAVIPCLDELSVEAKLIGAVNTVKNQDGRLIGYNTDGTGYMRSARENHVDIQGCEMILLGCGGAASAIAVQAALDGAAHIHLFARHSASWAHAEDLSEQINTHTSCHAHLYDIRDISSLETCMRRSVLLTNATSVGMSPREDQCPLPEDIQFPDSLTVSDVIYQPRRTLLLQRAEAQGCATFNGMYMLLHQGAAAFRIWTGRDMPLEMIRNRYFSS